MKVQLKVAACLSIITLLFSPITLSATPTPPPKACPAKLSPKVEKLAFIAFHWAKSHKSVKNTHYITVVDFSLPSNKKRLFVIDTTKREIVLATYVANGKGSGLYRATKFSNRGGTKASSLGVYTTLNPYRGGHGLSLQIKGLEAGINSNALRRSVVIHPAYYVTPAFIKAHHRAGRSWGCFAVNPHKSKQLIQLIKGGSVLFAYAAPELKDPNLLS